VLAADVRVVDGDRAAVEVSLYDAGPGVFLGLPREGPWLIWSGHDLLRIADERVAERWSQGSVAAGTEPLFENVLLNLPSGRGRGLGLFRAIRLDLLPGAVLSDTVDPSGAYLLVESGALSVRDRSSGDARSAEEEATVGPGERLRLAPGVGYDFRNDGAFPVAAFIVGIDPLDDGGRAGSTSTVADVFPAGVSRSLLASAVVADQPGGQVALTIGRATLGPGGAIATHAFDGTEIVAVAGGTAVVSCSRSHPCATLAPAESERRAVAPGEEQRAAVVAEAPESVVVRGSPGHSVRNGGDRSVGLVVLLLASTDPNPPAW
jgi:hypothetical protein